MDDTAENWVLTISQLAIFEGRPKTDVVRLISVKSPFDIPPAAFFLLSSSKETNVLLANWLIYTGYLLKVAL